MKVQKQKRAILTGIHYFLLCITKGWNPFFIYRSDPDISCWS